MKSSYRLVSLFVLSIILACDSCIAVDITNTLTFNDNSPSVASNNAALIQAALDGANSEVLIAPAQFRTLAVGRDIQIKASNQTFKSSNVIINFINSDNWHGLQFMSTATNSKAEGLHLRAAGTVYDYTGVYRPQYQMVLMNGANNELKLCVIEGAPNFGVQIVNDGMKVNYCYVFKTNGDGIHISRGNNVTISNNSVLYSGDDAIALVAHESSNSSPTFRINGALVSDNNISDSYKRGIYISGAVDNTTILSNTVNRTRWENLSVNEVGDVNGFVAAHPGWSANEYNRTIFPHSLWMYFNNFSNAGTYQRASDLAVITDNRNAVKIYYTRDSNFAHNTINSPRLGGVMFGGFWALTMDQNTISSPGGSAFVFFPITSHVDASTAAGTLRTSYFLTLSNNTVSSHPAVEAFALYNAARWGTAPQPGDIYYIFYYTRIFGNHVYYSNTGFNQSYIAADKYNDLRVENNTSNAPGSSVWINTGVISGIKSGNSPQ